MAETEPPVHEDADYAVQALVVENVRELVSHALIDEYDEDLIPKEEEVGLDGMVEELHEPCLGICV